MSDHVARRPNLESLKKEAKRWLAAVHGQVAEARARLERALSGLPANPTLRDVQHALAREHGFPGWTALKAKLAEADRVSAGTLERYQEMADALLDAYRTGTPAAMERHWSQTWHRRTWSAMRSYVQVDLGKIPGGDVDITLDEARHLVAREHGFGDWAALRRFVASMPIEGPVLAKPVAIIRTAISGNDASTESREWTAVLRRLADLEATGLDAHGQMTDALLADLGGLEHLTTLRLGGSRGITDAGIRHLAGLTRLRTLDLGGTAITDQALEVVAGLPALESISLAWTGVNDAGIAAVGRCEKLASVDLNGTRTGDGAIRTFAGKPALRRFLSGTAVTDAGLRGFHEYPVFKTWHGGRPELGLLRYDAEPNQLFLRGHLTDAGLANLRGLDGLFGLDLDAPLGLTGAGLAPLIDLPHLGWLSFDARDDAMPVIARMPSLRFLGCQDTTASDDGFVALSRSRSIEMIWGRRCHGLGRRGFEALATMPALRGLSVSCKNVDDAGLAALPRFPALRELMPMDVPDSGYRHVGRCEHLESLVLMYCRETTDAATEPITGLPRLERYFASYTRITDRTPALLAEIPSLERVTFDGCAGLTDRGVAALARLPRLVELTISGQQITAAVGSAFPDRVKVHYSR